MSEVEHANIYEAMAAAYTECGYVQKKKAADLNYRFAGERAMIEEIRPAMVRHGIFVYPHCVREVKRETYTTSRGSTMNLVGLVVTYRFAHESGEHDIVVEAYGEGADVGDKAAPKAMTGAFKYALRQAFCIETGDDPDNDSSAHQERQPKSRDFDKVPGDVLDEYRGEPLPPVPTVSVDMLSSLLKDAGMTDAVEKADAIGWAIDWNPVDLTTKPRVAHAVMQWAIREGITADVEMRLVDKIKTRKVSA